MYFSEAAKVVEREGMSLVVEKIDGYPKNKFPNINPSQIKVIVSDPTPLNKGCPSNLGKVSMLTGLAGL